ncbi:MAG: hypothetical protein JO345_26475 [Streptosporangiaceae bacterium]|nr:hypothetical protein [Streptosporangiaceae bacterium]
MAENAFDLTKTYVHLGLGSIVRPLPGFSWSAEYMAEYLRMFKQDRDEGRLVGIIPLRKTWTHWECHTNGDELVVLLSGRCDVIQEIDGEYHTISLLPGHAMINTRGVWHTSDVLEAGESLFISSGRRTTYRPRRADEGPRPAA